MKEEGRRRRLVVLGAVVAAGAISMAAVAYQQPASTDKVVEVNKLKDNLFVLTGGGGNTAVFVQSSGVTVVDTKNPGWGAPILAKIKELTPKPITTIINTHTHGDHVSGNVEFPATVEVVAHENTKANMDKMASGNVTPGPGGKPGAPSVLQGAGGKGLPKRTFKDRLTLGKGPDQIDLYYFGRAHTNGDAFVVFPTLRVMHTGDVFARKGLPFIDTNNGGSGVDYPDTLSKLHGGVKNVDTIITGHSTQMTMNDLREYADFMREFVTAVQTGKKAGQTADQIAASWKIGDKYKNYAASETAQVKAAVEAVLAGTK
jgi:glyoxylase-like metal-dependent hydrolase (beta-lactamase superfamily II)